MPGNDLLFHVLRQSTIGAERLDCRVRMGSYYTFAIITRQKLLQKIFGNVKFKCQLKINKCLSLFKKILFHPFRDNLLFKFTKNYNIKYPTIRPNKIANIKIILVFLGFYLLNRFYNQPNYVISFKASISILINSYFSYLRFFISSISLSIARYPLK